MFEDLAREATKMKDIVTKLRPEAMADPIDRFKAGGLLADLFVSYEAMKVTMLLEWDKYIRSLPPDNLMATYVRIWGNALSRDPLDTDLNVKLFKVTDARYYINQPQYYDDRTMRRIILELLDSTDRWVASLDKEIIQVRRSAPVKTPESQPVAGQTPPQAPPPEAPKAS